jgi:hypothetical protein
MAGTLVITTLSDGTNSTSATNCIQGSAKAWVNFNGTGTVAIRGSYNVSSITDNGTGDYTVNFTTAMPNANYSCVRSVAALGAGSGAPVTMGTVSQTTSAIRYQTGYVSSLGAGGTVLDLEFNYVAIFS